MRAAAALVLALLTWAAIAVQPAGATFTGSATGSGTVAAAAAFPTYPQQVTTDAPGAYFRLDDAAGAATAADAAGGLPGVFAPPIAATPALYLPLDETSGTVANDLAADGSPADGTLAGGTGWGTGYRGGALTLDGTTGYVTTPAVVDTTASFTVSAWVYLANPVQDGVALSQPGVNNMAYAIGYDNDTGKLVFSMPRADAITTTDNVISPGVAALNTWMMLVGSFDAATNTMRFWVDETSQGTTAHPTTWTSNAGSVVGGGLGGAFNWAGRIDEVRITPGLALSPATISTYVNGLGRGASTHWRFDENTGTAAHDASGTANRGTLGAGASWTAGHAGSAVHLSGGADGYVTGSRTTIDTAGAFTVSAWVYLDNTVPEATAVSQAGVHSSSFLIQYLGATTKWRFGLTWADGTGPTVSALTSAASVATWTHLTGVYDGVAGQMQLYVNGALSGTAAFAGAWRGSGVLNIGRRRWDDGYAGAWPGSIDDVRLFRRALGAAEVARVYADGAQGAYTPGTPGALDGAQQGQQAATAVAFAGRQNAYRPAALAGPGSFTAETWFCSERPALGPYDGTLINFSPVAAGDTQGADGGRRLLLDTGGNLVFAPDTTAAGRVSSSGTDYLDGRWHHVAVTAAPATGIRLYVDGDLAAATAYVAPPAGTGYWRWGGDGRVNGWTADYFLGTLDEVAFYPVALSAQQIAWHYHADH